MTTSLVIVENLLNEFYHPTTQNQRKREIENELASFKNQPNSWQQCLCVLSSDCCTTNEFLWLFTTSTLEFTITRRWMQLSAEERLHLRDNLWARYASLPCEVSRRQRDTIAQLIALIGKREFPDDHPNYINHCIELIKVHFRLGINLLRITSEEVVSSREDVSTERKQYFQSCVSLCIPEIINLLGKYLVISVCHMNGNALSAIPSEIADYNLYTSLPNDNWLGSSVLELLHCVQHILSWIPVDRLLSEYFLLALFDLARWRKQHPEISAAALTTVNELLYLQKAIPFPRTFMTAINALLDKNNYSKSNEMYEDKFTELLRLYSNKFSLKIVSDKDILDAFLPALESFTFNRHESPLPLSDKLEAWTPVLSAIATTSKCEQYTEVTQLIVTNILRQMRAEAVNKDFDNETVDENNQTEWQQYIGPCIEVIALIAELRPNATFCQVFRLCTRPFLVLIMSMEKAIDNKTFDPSNKTECRFFQHSLREVSMLCQALIRIAPTLDLTKGDCDEISQSLCTIVKTLISAINFFSSKKFQSLNVNSSLLIKNFIDLYAQSLLAVRSLLAISATVITEDQLRGLLHTSAQILLPSACNDSAVVQLAASQLLLSVASVIRPKFMLEVDSVVQLVRAGPALPHLPKQALPIVYEALISSLVLPWKNVSQQEQDYGRRCLVLQDYVGCLGQEFSAIDPAIHGSDTKLGAITTGVLPVFSEIINYFTDSNSTVKEMLVNAFKPSITKSMNILNVVGIDNHEVAITISDFALSVLRTLQHQLGMVFVKEMITLFINSSTRGEMTVRRLKSVEKILQMFQLIVQQPGSETMSLIPSILSFTLDHILPLFSYDKNLLDYSDVAHLMYSLFDSVLNCRWQYFYKTNVHSIIMNGSHNANNSNDHVQHPEQFIAIFNAYGQALVIGNDPNITRTVLLSLQNLNERWKLFHRALFKTNLLTSFQCALINALLSAEGALHYDLLNSVLFAMGQVNKLKLHESFMSIGFAASNSKVIEEICLATDIPTFTQKMSQLIQDTRCTRLTQ